MTWPFLPLEIRKEVYTLALKLMLCAATGAADPRKVIYTQRGSLYREPHDESHSKGETAVTALNRINLCVEPGGSWPS